MHHAISLASLIVLLCTASAQATTVTSTFVTAGRYAGGQTTYSDAHPTSSNLSVIKEAPEGGTGAGIAEASASYGVLRADAGAAGGQYASGGARAQASFNDIIVFNADGMTGRRGSTTMNLWFHWDLDSIAAGNSFAQTHGQINFYSGRSSSSRVTLNRANGYNSEHINYNSAFNNGVEVPFSFTIPLVVDFIFGREFSINASLSVNAAAAGMGPDRFGNVNGSAVAQANAGRSVYWAGFSDTEVGGVALGDFMVTSRSGTDWSLSQVPPVPEPRSVVLLVTGFLVLCIVRARNQKF
ncbi:hypothetical protein [Pseudoduganella albidiflava]|uniref:PEP-CTERM sorting domain-containing protein n=1 Tax=Pseudoduganella albidiflava TaxID=321983 RepID=A0A411X3R4_9BURK|nr:hypothetical protein [Pseudoduganella albidiflava]QBI03485.1 hypothetical protein EYF70_23665 [Pseudoduganella albidiflava]GGY50383.1 hypothetical protein GCM10007387_35870 [Pseudoduganella albidiflava]